LSLVILGVLPVLVEKAGVFNRSGVEIDDGIVGEFGDLQSVASRGLVGESEAAVEDDVVFWIEGIRINENGNMLVERIGAAGDGEFGAVPTKWEFGCDASEQYVAVRVAPEDKIAFGDVGVGDGSVVFNGRCATKLKSPFADGVRHGGGGPFADLVVHGFAGGADHDEGIHERVINRALDAVVFFQMNVRRSSDGSPAVLSLLEMGAK